MSTPHESGALQAGAALERALERLNALINWERRGRGRMRVTLGPALDLCARLGDPQRAAPAVHVAGSKGKGSVCALVAAGLRAAGLRAGRYGSPHVERIGERVTIDGREVEPGALAEGIERALAAREAALTEGTPARDATWFDLLTAAAWCVLQGAEVEWLVVECGLGGRFDSTNTLDGEVCVITSIELEHTAVLGSTRALIAAEKAGILVPTASLVTGVSSADEAGVVIDAAAREVGIAAVRPPWTEAGERPSITDRNRDLAGLVLDELGRRGHVGRAGEPLAGSLLTDGVAAAARLPGRLETRWLGSIPVVLDGAHTPGSVADVLRDLAATPPWGSARPVAILGLNRDKDLAGVLKSLAGRVDRVICTSVGGDLVRTPESIEEAARSLSLEAETADTPRMALERARESTPPRGWILVLGSLYLAGEIRPLVENKPTDAATC